MYSSIIEIEYIGNYTSDKCIQTCTDGRIIEYLLDQFITVQHSKKSQYQFRNSFVK